MENCFNSIMQIITKNKSLYITWKIIREITLQRDYSLYSLEKVEFTEFLSKSVKMLFCQEGENSILTRPIG